MDAVFDFRPPPNMAVLRHRAMTSEKERGKNQAAKTLPLRVSLRALARHCAAEIGCVY